LASTPIVTILSHVDGSGVPVVVEVSGAGTGSTPPSIGGGSLPVTGMGLTLVLVAIVAIVAGFALKAVQR
jgi:hypothetical protein